MNHLPRWVTSLHEAGHAIAAHALTGSRVTATLHDGDWGAAWPWVDSSPTVEAIWTAAGPIAESLAERHAAPELPPEIASRPPTVEMIAPAETAAGLRRQLATASPDCVLLARFCISGIEGQPERWAKRYVWIHSLAERLIQNHELRIVEAARVLYLRGMVSVPLLPERNAS